MFAPLDNRCEWSRHSYSVMVFRCASLPLYVSSFIVSFHFDFLDILRDHTRFLRFGIQSISLEQRQPTLGIYTYPIQQS